MDYKYKAFISYRHRPLDQKVVVELQKLLETYKPPKNLEKRLKADGGAAGGAVSGAASGTLQQAAKVSKNKHLAWRIFRDESELPTNSSLGKSIEEALENSEFLDSALIYDTNGELKSSSNIEEIKGLGAGKFDEGVYQYEYDSEFVRSCDSKGLVRVVNGDNPGANSLNIPGCQTWAGEEIGNSESELLMPSVDVKGYSSDDVFSSISEKGYFEIKDPIVLDQNGNRIQVTGKFKIKKLR